MCDKWKEEIFNKSTCSHIIGYLDGSGTGVSGIERAYDSYLNEVGGEIDVRYHCDALEKSLSVKSRQLKTTVTTRKQV